MAERIQNPTNDQDRAWNLLIDIEDEKQRKKAAVKDFNENIKRLQEEIDALLDNGTVDEDETEETE